MFYLRSLDNLLYSAYLPIAQTHLDPVRVLRRIRQQFGDYAPGALSGGLILFEHDVHDHARADIFPVFPVF